MDDNLRHKTLTHSPSSIYKQVNEQRLIIYPEFKGKNLWDDARRSQFIESIMLGMPTQPVWCEESKTGDHLIIDGSERVNAICDFLAGTLVLTKLRMKKELEGASVISLPYHEVLNLRERFQISFVIVNFDAKPELKCEFYHRLLESEYKYKTQAARNFGYRAGLEFLRELREKSLKYVHFEKSKGPYASRERFESKIDEIFLYLILFNAIQKYEEYVPPDYTVEDLLDSLMDRLSNNDPERANWGNDIEWQLSRIAKHFEKVISVSVGTGPTYREDMNLHQFYFSYLKSQNSLNLGPPRFPILSREIHPGVDAKKFISAINKVRHAQ